VRPEDSHSLDSLLACTGIVPTHRHLVSRWLALLVRHGKLLRNGETFSARAGDAAPARNRAPAERASLQELWRETEERLRDNRELLAYVRNCASRLASIVTGRDSALESLFPGGSFALATALYEQSATMRYINALAATGVEAVVRVLPPGRVLRLLEIGAGTGGTTSSLLHVLPAARSDYLFTDVSDAFLEHARHRFAEFPQLRFGRYDLDEDPRAQGCTDGQFDVIVSANCVHAARDLRAVLARLRALLAPGGLLMLVESTTHHDVYDMTTGLIEGWQAFADDLRADHPLLAPESWTAAMRDAGFVEARAWPEGGSLADALGQHLVVARAPGDAGVWPTGTTTQLSASASVNAAGPVRTNADLRTRLSHAMPGERAAVMCDTVRREVMRILRLDPDSPPARHDRLMDLGMDSLMAVQLRNALATVLAMDGELPSTLIFDYPTIEAIAHFLLERSGFGLRPADPSSPKAPVTGRATVPTTASAAATADVIDAATIAAMTDDEIAATLLAREEGA
jgi:SAM-dependent methyltransferase